MTEGSPAPITAATAFSKHVNLETLQTTPLFPKGAFKPPLSWGQKALPGMGEHVIPQLGFGESFRVWQSWTSPCPELRTLILYFK